MRRVIVLALLFALLGFLAWARWLGGVTKPVAAANSTDSAALDARGAPSESFATQAGSAELAGGSAARPDRTALLQQLMNDANRSIRFFGLVIDQNAHPVPGVTVTLQIRRTKAVGPLGIGDTFDYPTLTTGADGRFTLTDAKGALLAVKSLEKSGYEPSAKALRSSYWYWREPKDAFHPNAEHPEIFRMWKKAGAERLVRKGISVPLRYDGTAASIDLISGSVASSGDLRVTLVRTPTQIIYGQRNYEWTFTVEALNGGFVASNDEQMYRAPVQGYQPRMVIHMPADAKDWMDEKSYNIYLKLRGGQLYGRAELKVLVGSDRQTTPFYITSFINPSGSQNLEYDPLQDAGEPPMTVP